jgi:hypothetical protein
MNKQEIYSTIKSLASSQGFYGRILDQIDDHPEILDILEAQNFTDIVDLIMYLEQ